MDEVISKLPEWGLFALGMVYVFLHFYTKRDEKKNDPCPKMADVYEIVTSKDVDGIPRVYVRSDMQDAIRRLVDLQADQYALLSKLADMESAQDEKLKSILERLAS